MSDLRKFWLLFQLRRNAWRKTEDLMKIQEKKLRAIVKHAYENVEFYHKKFDSMGIKPDDVQSVKDLKKLPMVTKQEIQDGYPAEIVAKGFNIEKLEKYTTSGSTGMPLTVVLDGEAEDFRAAVFGRPFFECGLGLRDKMMFVGDVRHFPSNTTWYQKMGFLKRAYLSASVPVENDLPLIARHKPDAVYGYSSYILLLAHAVKKLGIREVMPDLVFGTAEIMTKETRDAVKSVFNTEIFDLYGCVETERLAWECREHVGYHMDIDSTVIEFVKDGEEVAPGESGQIVLTCLYNKAMPLIRYAVGDVGTPTEEKCPCGRGLPLMKNIVGRTDDLVLRSDGRIVVPENFANIMRNIPGIAQFRVIQENENLIAVQLVKGKNFSEATVQRVIEDVKEVVGNDVTVEPRIVDEIEKDQSGKIRAVISKVHSSKIF